MINVRCILNHIPESADIPDDDDDIIVVEEDANAIDREKIDEMRRAYLEESRSQETTD